MQVVEPDCHVGFHTRHPPHFAFRLRSDKQLSCLSVLQWTFLQRGQVALPEGLCRFTVSSATLEDAHAPTSSPTLCSLWIYHFCPSLWHLALILISLITRRLIDLGLTYPVVEAEKGKKERTVAPPFTMPGPAEIGWLSRKGSRGWGRKAERGWM